MGGGFEWIAPVFGGLLGGGGDEPTSYTPAPPPPPPPPPTPTPLPTPIEATPAESKPPETVIVTPEVTSTVDTRRKKVSRRKQTLISDKDSLLGF